MTESTDQRTLLKSFLPAKTLGFLMPLEPHDYVPYEFYRIAPPGVMACYLSVGLRTFTREDVRRVFEPIEGMVERLRERNVDIVVQSGTPLPILLGVEEHDRLMQRIAELSGVPVTSTVNAVVDAARHLGIRRILAVNKWTTEMNASLAEFFGRRGVSVEGVSSQVMFPDQFITMSAGDGMQLAYDLARQAVDRYPDADGIYIGGGAWLALPIAQVLEKELGLPVISNQDAVLWDCLHRVDHWTPRPGLTRLLTTGRDRT